DYFNRNEEPAGTAFLQGYSVSGVAAGAAARVLHEGTGELSVSPQAVRAAQPADSEWAGGDFAVPVDCRVGEDDGDGRPGGDCKPAGGERRVGEAGRTRRGLPGAGVSGLRTMFYHGNAAQGGGERCDYCESPSILCRSGDQAAGEGGSRCGDTAGCRDCDF